MVGRGTSPLDSSRPGGQRPCKVVRHFLLPSAGHRYPATQVARGDLYWIRAPPVAASSHPHADLYYYRNNIIHWAGPRSTQLRTQSGSTRPGRETRTHHPSCRARPMQGIGGSLGWTPPPVYLSYNRVDIHIIRGIIPNHTSRKKIEPSETRRPDSGFFLP